MKQIKKRVKWVSKWILMGQGKICGFKWGALIDLKTKWV